MPAASLGLGSAVTVTVAAPAPCISYWNSWGHDAAAPLPPDDRADRNTDNTAWSSGHGSKHWDTDAFWIPGDCVMRDQRREAGIESPLHSDRRDKSSTWIKVESPGGGAGPIGGGDGGSGTGGGGTVGNEQRVDLTGDGIADLAPYHQNGHLYVHPGAGARTRARPSGHRGTTAGTGAGTGAAR